MEQKKLMGRIDEMNLQWLLEEPLSPPPPPPQSLIHLNQTWVHTWPIKEDGQIYNLEQRLKSLRYERHQEQPTPEQIAQLDRWIAEAEAELAQVWQQRHRKYPPVETGETGPQLVVAVPTLKSWLESQLAAMTGRPGPKDDPTNSGDTPCG